MAEIFGEPLKEILLRYTVKDSEQNSNVDKINW
jgi:hypothetical protein